MTSHYDIAIGKMFSLQCLYLPRLRNGDSHFTLTWPHCIESPSRHRPTQTVGHVNTLSLGNQTLQSQHAVFTQGLLTKCQIFSTSCRQTNCLHWPLISLQTASHWDGPWTKPRSDCRRCELSLVCVDIIYQVWALTYYWLQVLWGGQNKTEYTDVWSMVRSEASSSPTAQTAPQVKLCHSAALNRFTTPPSVIHRCQII